MWDELDIARRRRNEYFVTEAMLIRNAVGAVMSEQGAKHFQKTIKMLTDD